MRHAVFGSFEFVLNMEYGESTERFNCSTILSIHVLIIRIKLDIPIHFQKTEVIKFLMPWH